MLWDSVKKIKILKLLWENSIVFSFIISEKNILLQKLREKNVKFCKHSVTIKPDSVLTNPIGKDGV